MPDCGIFVHIMIAVDTDFRKIGFFQAFKSHIKVTQCHHQLNPIIFCEFFDVDSRIGVSEYKDFHCRLLIQADSAYC